MKNDEIIQKNNELFAALKQSPENTKEYQRVVAKIVANNVLLVRRVAKKYAPILQGATFSNEDLIAEGLIGLLNAVKTFDAAKGIPFQNYAWPCIENEMIRLVNKEHKHFAVSSLEDPITSNENGKERKQKDVLAAPVNFEEEIVEKDEKQHQSVWLRKNLNQIKPYHQQILTAKYLSGETELTNDVLAKQFKCTQQNISRINKRAIANLRKIVDNESHQEEIIAQKAVLKKLILTELPLKQQKVMIHKFYATTKKTNEQIAQEVNIAPITVENYIHQACAKLCTLCDSIQDKKQLKNILAFNSVLDKEC